MDPTTAFKQYVTQEEVALLVMNYLHQEHFTRTYEAFVQESKHLVTSIRQTRSAKNLQALVGEYIALKDAETRRLAFANHFSSNCAPLSRMLSDLSAVIEAYKTNGVLQQPLAVMPPPPDPSPPENVAKRPRIVDRTSATVAPPPAEAPPSPRKGSRKPSRPKRMAEDEGRAYTFTEDLLGFAQAPAPVRLLVTEDDLAERIAQAINEQRQGEPASELPVETHHNFTQLAERALEDIFSRSDDPLGGIHGIYDPTRQDDAHDEGRVQ